MNQTTQNQQCQQSAESGNPSRVSTRDLVTIGQRWRRRARAVRDRYEVVITQVHRADRQVDAYRVAEDGPVAGARLRIRFTVLREQYSLISTNSAKEEKDSNEC